MQLFRAMKGTICAGWAEDEAGEVLACAPILRRFRGPEMVERVRRAGFEVERVEASDQAEA